LRGSVEIEKKKREKILLNTLRGSVEIEKDLKTVKQIIKSLHN
jgi:hypothetical protein